MGKNQHSKDRMFITATEWAHEYGGHKKRREGKLEGALPFECCALTLVPFESPACTRDGVLFEALNILPFVKTHKKSPVTNAKTGLKDVVRLKMAKSAEGAWHCPVTCKVFNNFSKVAAVATTGNVYAYEALKELCFKRGSLLDLLDSTPFERSDVILLHDPEDAELCARRDISNFAHLIEERARRARELETKTRREHINTSDSVDVVLKEARENVAKRDAVLAEKEAAALAILNDPNSPANKGLSPGFLRVLRLGATTNEVLKGYRETSGATSGSLTSSRMNVSTDSGLRCANAEELRTARWKTLRGLGKKGYVQLQTTAGEINIEVHCDVVPRAAENFLGLCASGYYDGLSFHRIVRNFMAQGGDPSGLGTGGESLWGAAFADEFDSRLSHDARGVLSYANNGRDKNRSQFFLTFKSCKHLDNKHTIFGRVVGGMDALSALERLPVDAADEHRPKAEATIVKTLVFVDPTKDADLAFEEELLSVIAKRVQPEVAERERQQRRDAAHASNARLALEQQPHSDATVGKYFASGKKPASAAAACAARSDDLDEPESLPDSTVPRKRKLAAQSKYSFSDW